MLILFFYKKGDYKMSGCLSRRLHPSSLMFKFQHPSSMLSKTAASFYTGVSVFSDVLANVGRFTSESIYVATLVVFPDRIVSVESLEFAFQIFAVAVAGTVVLRIFTIYADHKMDLVNEGLHPALEIPLAIAKAGLIGVPVFLKSSVPVIKDIAPRLFGGALAINVLNHGVRAWRGCTNGRKCEVFIVKVICIGAAICGILALNINEDGLSHDGGILANREHTPFERWSAYAGAGLGAFEVLVVIKDFIYGMIYLCNYNQFAPVDGGPFELNEGLLGDDDGL
jgi:hypothetical protein